MLPLCASALLLLGGCAHDTVSLDRHLGDSLRQAQSLQTVYPPGHWSAPRPGSDGVVAVHAIDRYEQSYAKPLPPVNVMNIGLGTPQQAGAVPR
jgi:hypothetical protein